MQNLKGMRIGVLMGGMSTERDISLRSGNAVYNALVQKGYDAVAVDVGNDVYNNILKERIDIAFLALHGKYGEDGTIQGLLEIVGIPYTGSDILSSAISINKALAKRLFMFNKIPTPAFKVIKRNDVISNTISKAIGLPLIVKPNSQGSTIGVSIVNSKKEIKGAVEKALEYDDTVLIEEFIRGRELTVGILGSRTLPIIEIKPKSGLYDFNAKYTKGMTDYIVPAQLSKELNRRLSSIALRAFDVLGCSGVGRVDIMLDNRNRPYVLEVNTIPGMTELSLLPKAAASAGIGFSNLVEEILLDAARKPSRQNRFCGRNSASAGRN
ncbi:MAG: D-alanine--D-alanine ligase [Deltaproteobacteria bacterium GWC2_42_51]|nr:MAG: D-alanine--D-alanine ligase [Deltaproteobacteria bacterium GWA2_42_85]OGP28876.1 MAG: D-alanine--D-alanine ligase [Deltaproteobacteria bacterium GWB2_42_7]OGP31068.1 MAG: D-alanine--D-alanine ligase [Deltaproteobacteria bacterium GWC2_42_51]OGP43751.1 MAG: D-alanine--D-alanine ligase [Deltaproteobacteria bacterium GWD2_42_10]OGP46063.1 MAG: D-alanine--D-alanine ligase [Deltaproteobacteria bacterium GWF2_42_12]OGQ23891.1 MAG: D-alanine--D-alanine ligase [Deltaproteobacteria bacterium RI